ncbi:unnamed protein product [Closterium sp. Yama58-4]|nr:unnamed protein product [Closterium sp. Yama58-4]
MVPGCRKRHRAEKSACDTAAACAAIRLHETTETGVEAAEAGEAAEPTTALPQTTTTLTGPQAAPREAAAEKPEAAQAMLKAAPTVPETATTMPEAQDAPCEAQDAPCEAQNAPCEAQDAPCEAQNAPCEAQDAPCEAQNAPCEAQDAPCEAAPNTVCTDVGMHEMAEQEVAFRNGGMHADAACQSHGEKQGGDDMETQDDLCSAGMHVDAQRPPGEDMRDEEKMAMQGNPCSTDMHVDASHALHEEKQCSEGGLMSKSVVGCKWGLAACTTPGESDKSLSLQRNATASRRKPPLLMLHGFGASAIWQWTNQVAAFSRDFDVVLPDLVFFGGSRSRSDQRSEMFQADVMLRLLDRLEIAECALVGLSYGGFVAYRMACLEPGRVQRLVLAGSGLMTSAEEHAAVLGEWQVEHIAELLLPDDPQGVQRLMHLAYAHDAPVLPAWVLRSTHEVS